MNITEQLDVAIKQEETGTQDGYYKTMNRRAYMTFAEWEKFKEAMENNKLQPMAHIEFGEGGGGEMKEKDGRPPKMASFGSSSRMIYMLSHEKAGFHYEKKLHTTVGGTANLDGFYEDENRYIFVEAKCHEPYSTKNVSVSRSYGDLYRYINEQMLGNVHIDMQTSKCGKYLNVEYFAAGKKLERFDMKQMICHLLGIATGMLKGTLARKRTDFIYLLYDPTKLNIDPDAKEEIDRIYERTCYECNLVNFRELYRVILNFLIKDRYRGVANDLDVDDILLNFKFMLTSQEDYSVLIRRA